MFRLNFWAQSLMNHASLPISGSIDPRYSCLSSVPSALPLPPMSLLYNSPPPGLLLPESLYRRPMIGLSDDSEKSSPELNDNMEPGHTSSTSSRMYCSHRQLDSAECTSSASRPTRTHQLSYPSLLLHTQLEALRHYQQQQQQQCDEVRQDAVADKFRSVAGESSSSEISAFRQPRRRRTTPDHPTTDTGVKLIVTAENRTSPVLLQNDDVRSPARKSGISS